MKTKHTPGPWMTWDESAAEISILRHDDTDEPEGNRVVAVAWIAPSHYEVIANARLIAAAPELLEALKGACEEHDGVERRVAPWYLKASAAIAKAEGRS